MKSLLRGFIGLNQRLSLAIDRLILPDRMRLDGNGDFKTTIVPRVLQPGSVVYDLGGGSNPYIEPETKAALDLYVVGLDISKEELRLAPPGVMTAP